MVVHAAFGGSTNLLLHIPAIAHAAGLPRPTVDDWTRINRRVPRLVDVLPNGPVGHPTVRVFLAGGVPEVMLHLRELGLLRPGCADRQRAAPGRGARRVGAQRAAAPAARAAARGRRRRSGRRDPDARTRAEARADQHRHLSPRQPGAGRLGGQEHRHRPQRASTPTASTARSARPASSPANAAAIAAIKGQSDNAVRPGDVIVLIGRGPLGSGMEETYQITSALRYLPWGKRGGADHRRPLQRREHRRLHRPRGPGGAGRRPHRPRARRRPHPDRRSTR